MIFKNAVFYFVALLLVLIGGFWKSYFSVLDSDISLAQHFHGISMLLWVLLLISQSWLVRRQNMKLHRATGKLSFVLAPLVVWSGLLVVLDNLAKWDDPFTQGALNILWFGIFLVLLFTLLYGLTIFYRKNMHLHARYIDFHRTGFPGPRTGPSVWRAIKIPWRVDAGLLSDHDAGLGHRHCVVADGQESGTIQGAIRSFHCALGHSSVAIQEHIHV